MADFVALRNCADLPGFASRSQKVPPWKSILVRRCALWHEMFSFFPFSLALPRLCSQRRLLRIAEPNGEEGGSVEEGGRRKAPPEQLLFNSPQVAVPMSEVANNGTALVGRRSTNHWLRWAMLGGAGYTQKVSHFAHRPLCVIAALHASPSGLWLRGSLRCSKSPQCSTLLAPPDAVCAAPNISAGAFR